MQNAGSSQRSVVNIPQRMSTQIKPSQRHQENIAVCRPLGWRRALFVSHERDQFENLTHRCDYEPNFRDGEWRCGAAAAFLRCLREPDAKYLYKGLDTLKIAFSEVYTI
jgi:hypothetical protein